MVIEYRKNDARKFLAAIAVFAMVFTAFAVVDLSATSDAYETEIGSDLGDIAFDTVVADGDKSNANLKNRITVSYDAAENTYNLSGVLSKQDKTITTDDGAESNYKVLYFVDGKLCTINVLNDKAMDSVAVKVGDLTYYINVSDLEKSEKPLSSGYTIVKNSNALNDLENVTSGTDGNKGKWSYDADNKVLTLDNYQGEEAFIGSFSKLVLIGDNKITLAGAEYAIATDSDLEIKCIDGIVTLGVEIVNNDEETEMEVAGILAMGVLKINGIKNVDVAVSNACPDSVGYGIFALGFDIYESNVTVSCDEDLYENSVAMISLPHMEGDKTVPSAVTIRSSNITLAAGAIGMLVYGNVSIAASEVAIGSAYVSIEADAIDIASSSKVTAEVNEQGENPEVAFAIVADSIKTQSESVLVTDSMYISGQDSTNNATVTVNGDMIVEDGAKYVNKSVFVNNGEMGVYGQFVNQAGTFTNNGSVNTYKYALGNMEDSNVKITEDVSINVINMELLSDGSYYIVLDVCDGKDCEILTGTVVYDGKDIKINASSDGMELSLDVTTEDKKEVYEIYISGTFADSETEIEVEENLDKSLFDEIKGVFVDVPSALSINGGKFDNTEKGKVALDSAAAVALVAGGEFVNSGELKTAVDVIITGKISGNDVEIPEDKKVTLSGDVNMTFTYNGEYTGKDKAKVAFSNAVKVTGNCDKVVLNAPKATSDNQGAVLIEDDITAKANKTVKVTVVKGTVNLENMAVGNDAVLEALAGSTVVIDKKGAVSEEGVISVQDGATINMKIAKDKETNDFGVLKYTISFKNNGFTYYGSLKFALANAVEGAELVLNQDAQIVNGADDAITVTVKDNITLTFSKNTTLTLSNINLIMGDGAKFVLADQATINMTDVTLTGNIVFDVNEIAFKEFAVDGKATITEKAASKKVVSNIKIEAGANAGLMTAVKGTIVGNIVLSKVMDKEDKTAVKSVANLTIAEGAILNADVIDNDKSVITVNGVMNIEGTKTFNGTVTGNGNLALANKATVKFVEAAVADVMVSNGDDCSVDFAKALANKAESADKTNFISVTAIDKAGSVPAYIAVSGTVYSGDMAVAGTVALDTVVIETAAKVTVPAGATLNIKKDTESTANGLIMVAGTLNMKTDKVTKYGALNYQITYKSGEFTVYTQLSTGVNNGEPGDVFAVGDNLTIDNNVEIPAGVTITVAEGKKITLVGDNYISVGTPIKALGAVTSGIQGTVLLKDNSFVIVYNDSAVDMSKAKIVTDADGKVVAKDSQYTFNYAEYATVFVAKNDAAVQNLVNGVLVPSVDGYRFLGWNGVVPGKVIGETDFEAIVKADAVQVVFENVDGVKYYVNGNLMNTVGAPVFVKYGSTITAIADYGYTGHAQVNGKDYIKVTTDLKVVTGSGVAIVEPAPAPEIEDDDGLGITDYLLIVLVVLTAVLAVIVAMRLMRS